MKKIMGNNIFRFISLGFILLIFFGCSGSKENKMDCDQAGHCKYQEFSKDGVLIVESDFVDGVQHGYTKLFYPSGNLKRIAKFVDGVNQDTIIEYYENGHRSKEYCVVDRVLEGHYIEFSEDESPLVYGYNKGGNQVGCWWTPGLLYEYSQGGDLLDSLRLRRVIIGDTFFDVVERWERKEVGDKLVYVSKEGTSNNVVLGMYDKELIVDDMCDEIETDLTAVLNQYQVLDSYTSACGANCCDFKYKLVNGERELTSRARYFKYKDEIYSFTFTMFGDSYDYYLPYIEMAMRYSVQESPSI